jgi:hypothetical protein
MTSMNQVGITTDGRPIVSGFFPLVGTRGLPLEIILAVERRRRTVTGFSRKDMQRRPRRWSVGGSDERSVRGQFVAVNRYTFARIRFFRSSSFTSFARSLMISRSPIEVSSAGFSSSATARLSNSASGQS